MMRLSELVRRERERRGWRPIDLARAAGVSKSVITNLENGKRLGRADTIAKVTQALGIDPERMQRLLAGEAEEVAGVGESSNLLRLPSADLAARIAEVSQLLADEGIQAVIADWPELSEAEKLGAVEWIRERVERRRQERHDDNAGGIG